LVKIYLAGKGAAGAVLPASIVALTEEVLRAMLIKKLIFVVAVIIVSTGLLLVGTGAGMQLYHGAAAEPGGLAAPAPTPNAQAKAAQKAPQAKEQDDPKKANVSKPEKREVAPYEVFTGRLEASQTIDISAPVSGRLLKIHCQSGAAVKKGDLLFELGRAAFEEAVTKARLNCDAAEARAKPSQALFDHYRGISKLDEVGKIELDKAALHASLDRTALELAKLELNRAQRELESTVVKAPADGRVGKILVNEGGGVSGDKTVLATITVADPMIAVFQLDQSNYRLYQRLLGEKEVSGLGSPMSFRLSDEEGFPHKGKLAAFDDRFDPKIGTIMVRATVANPDGQLLPGMSVGVQMVFGKPQPKLLVPETAIQPPRKPFDTPVVAVITGKNFGEEREVTLGLAYGAMRVIEEGLSAEDRILVNFNDATGHAGYKIEQRKK
jgi:RND family efflux transporter MFP subunit